LAEKGNAEKRELCVVYREIELKNSTLQAYKREKAGESGLAIMHLFDSKRNKWCLPLKLD
jgi:hypothetical protein